AKTVNAGRQPGTILVHEDKLYVANEDSDTISQFTRTQNGLSDRRDHKISLEENGLFGAIPTAMSVESDGTTLNVTLGGLNALARLDMTKNFAVKSVVPTGWFPIAMGRLGDTLVVANSKGIGGRAQSPAS